jgi:hypothetical protein
LVMFGGSKDGAFNQEISDLVEVSGGLCKHFEGSEHR